MSSTLVGSTVIRFSGHEHLRNRLVLCLLSGKPVKIDKIRSEDKNPGLRDYEVSLLRLLEGVCNGMAIEISFTGTSVMIKPGIILGGVIRHDCPTSRSIGYFLEPVLMLAPFAKTPLQLTLTGVTSDDKDLSVDLIRTVTLPHLSLFGISDGVELKIKKRGAYPLGGGEVQFLCPIVRSLKIINFVEPGKIKRIRGIAHAVRVSPQMSHRMVEASRSVLNRYIPDLYLHTDVYKGQESGKSPGFGLSLLAESTTSAIFGAEAMSAPGVTPEEVALCASRLLLQAIQGGGCVDQNHQCLVMLLMVLGSEDVGRCRIGSLSERSVQFLRDIKDVFGTTFKISPAEALNSEATDLVISCYGVGEVEVCKCTDRTPAAVGAAKTYNGVIADLVVLNMPPVPIHSPATGAKVPDYFLHTTCGQFVDTSGRVVLLRGVNLSGDSKYPRGANSHTIESFWEGGESGDVSFVGKPFSLEEADVHLERLRGWGMNLIRYIVCWEALEHQGPGIYDEHFIDFTIAILRKCKEFGFRVYMDPHQDVWSRFSGGSGAPFWTLHAAGLDPRNFTATGGLIHNEYPDPAKPEPDAFPIMAWPTSYYRMPTMTMFTLFFGGRDYAPKCIIDGINIQDYLQNHMIEAFGHLADRIRDAGDLLDSCLIGWECFNEPSEGFLGMEDLNLHPPEQQLKRESCPTPAQAIRLGSGIAQNVGYWKFSSVGPVRNGSINIDPRGASAWLDPNREANGKSSKWGWQRDPGWSLGQCIWEQHGVWDKASGNISKPSYFRASKYDPSKKIDFLKDHWFPYWNAFTKRMRLAHPEAIAFIHPPVFQPPPLMKDADIRGRAAYSPHFYDGLTMITRHWNWFNSSTLHVLRNKIHIVQSFKVGDDMIKKNFIEQFAVFREDVEHNVGAYPVVIGETGTPFDVDEKESYGRTDGGIHIGNHFPQQRALDASLTATDANNDFSYTIWAYNPAHSWEHGDGFNKEDLSIWSADDRTYRRHVKFEKLAEAAAKHTFPQISVDSEEVNPSDLENKNAAVASQGSSAGLENDALPVPKSLTFPKTTTFEFLVDGARAIHAFCRPYPLKTLGKPGSLSYDILNGTFSMSVIVQPSDVASGSSGHKHPPTEIYLPLTTFSSPPTLLPVPKEELPEENELKVDPAEMPAPVEAPSNPAPGAAPSSSWDKKRGHTVQEAISRLHLAFAGQPTRAAAGYALHMSSDPPLPLQIPKDVLDVDVEVSSGTWELDGQRLIWYYDVPEEATSTYTITVTKRNAKLTAVDRSGNGCVVM